MNNTLLLRAEWGRRRAYAPVNYDTAGTIYFIRMVWTKYLLKKDWQSRDCGVQRVALAGLGMRACRGVVQTASQTVWRIHAHAGKNR